MFWCSHVHAHWCVCWCACTQVSVMPAFAEFSNPNTACIFTTPPASVAAGLALPKKRKMNAKSTATVSTSDPAATASATPEKVASPAPEPSRHSQQLQQQQQERKQRTWRRSFVVALPSAMLPTFRGLGARVFYMATITVGAHVCLHPVRLLVLVS